RSPFVYFLEDLVLKHALHHYREKGQHINVHQSNNPSIGDITICLWVVSTFFTTSAIYGIRMSFPFPESMTHTSLAPGVSISFTAPIASPVSENTSHPIIS